MIPPDLLSGLSGEAMIREGLNDAAHRRETVAACLVTIALPRLRHAGLVDGNYPGPVDGAELRLYRLLRQAKGDAYSAYNARIRQLVSFEQARDRRLTARSPAVT